MINIEKRGEDTQEFLRYIAAIAKIIFFFTKKMDGRQPLKDYIWIEFLNLKSMDLQVLYVLNASR